MNDDFCSIAIYCYGDSLSIDETSELVGLAPTRARKRGEVRTTSTGSEVVQRIGMWEYRLSVGINEVASSMAKMVGLIKCDRLLGRAGVEKAELDVFVPLDHEDNGRVFSMEMPCGLMARLSELGMDFVFTSS